jgi:hypothetical protein
VLQLQLALLVQVLGLQVGQPALFLQEGVELGVAPGVALERERLAPTANAAAAEMAAASTASPASGSSIPSATTCVPTAAHSREPRTSRWG